MIDKTLYTENSIESLDPLSFTRLKPGVYCGDTTYATQLLVEIFSNAVDEYTLGHGNKIDVEIQGTKCKVRDYGQGFIPNSFREDGKTILEAAFSVLNTSGKYREDGTYAGTSLGSFGIGSKLTNFLSHWLDVCTCRNGEQEHIHFVEGVFEKRASAKIDSSNIPNGTLVEWEPSEEFFTYPEINIKDIRSLFKTIACLCPGLTITLNYNGEVETYFSKNGINDLVDEAVKNKELINHRLIISRKQGKEKIDFVLTYTTNYNSTIIPYINTGLTENGPHITQIKTIITRELNKFFRDKKWIKDKEENLSGEDLQEGIYVVFNLTASNVAYNAQVKTTVTKIEMRTFNSIITEELRQWCNQNEKELKIIADKALSARKAREAAKKARDAVRDKSPKGTKSKLLNLPTKLVDCWSKERSKCELLIAEGDSAASGLVEARDAEIHAVFPVRGKVIAAYKNADSKIFTNQEVINLIKAIGLDLDTKTNKLIYDERKLRYGKILLCADADPDGAAIRNLLIELFWWLCPELILNGHIYTTTPPLFRITTKKNEYIFLKDQVALERYKKEHINEKYLVNRNKGLGEQDAEELAEALLNPTTRNVEQLIVEERKSTEDLIECLLGPSVPPRRAYLLAHSEEANEND